MAAGTYTAVKIKATFADGTAVKTIGTLGVRRRLTWNCLTRSSDDLRKRLARAGQAVERMLAEHRECRDIITQLSAAINTLEQTGFRLLAAGLTFCIEHPEESAASGYPLDEVQRLFTKLA